jgi:hypothetical protein
LVIELEGSGTGVEASMKKGWLLGFAVDFKSEIGVGYSYLLG